VYKWNYIWSKGVIETFQKIGFKNDQQFNQFILENSITKEDSRKKAKADEISPEINRIERTIRNLEYGILDNKEQFQFGFSVLAIISIIAFPFRYLLMAIRWSVKTINKK
jgi:hypothetical protein